MFITVTENILDNEAPESTLRYGKLLIYDLF